VYLVKLPHGQLAVIGFKYPQLLKFRDVSCLLLHFFCGKLPGRMLVQECAWMLAGVEGQAHGRGGEL
jgi:hypothetical protein